MKILTWKEALLLIKEDKVKCSMEFSEIENWIIKHKHLDRAIHTDDLGDDGLVETYVSDYSFIVVYTDGNLDAIIYAYEPMNPRIFVDTVLIPDNNDVRCYNKKLRIFG
jgi:hypothetical protein